MHELKEKAQHQHPLTFIEGMHIALALALDLALNLALGFVLVFILYYAVD